LLGCKYIHHKDTKKILQGQFNAALVFWLNSSKFSICYTLGMPSTLAKPSALIHDIRSELMDDMMLFKFSDSLQLRMEELLEKNKLDKLTLNESGELEAIGELDRIFTHINAMISAQHANQ
jgi:hypothetical protein